MTLTWKETELLRLLFEGYKWTEIAKITHTKPTTIKTQSQTLFQKLGAENRVQAVMFALEHYKNGILKLSGPPQPLQPKPFPLVRCPDCCDNPNCCPGHYLRHEHHNLQQPHETLALEPTIDLQPVP